ncbi:hypothetical protein [Microbulbifer taiwanensis]|uniref:Spore coat protein U domain-containing protein n=1 Tax=Microbulbifer taiwanensis TaxID=986746 RepID=A0ABW1YQ71_9GAMM|nr:hypothetical protein [Microbulbifer taiwanensis]
MQRTNFLVFFILLASLFATAASAQNYSNNSDPCSNGSNADIYDRFIGVCELQDTSQVIPFDSSTSPVGSIEFGIRSCGRGSGWFDWSCATATPYRVQVIDSASSGTSFTLTNSVGTTVPVGFSFRRSGGSPIQLQPNQWSGGGYAFAGSVNQTSTYLELTVPSAPSLAPGVYSNTFEFTLEQQEHCGILFCSDATLSPIEFAVDLIIPDRIRISGLEDMEIAANLTGLSQGQQYFCVYSQGAQPFGITAHSGTGSGTFLLAGIDTVEYETWIADSLGGSPEQLSEGIPSILSWAGHLQDDCPGGENMLLDIRIQQSALMNIMDTSYTDTLTLTVTLD